MLALVVTLAVTVEPTGPAVSQTAPPASVALSRDDREALAESILHGSPDDPIRRSAGVRNTPPTITQQQAWAQVVDGNTLEGKGGSVVGEAELERQRLAVATQQDAEARARYTSGSFGEMIGAAWNRTLTASLGRTFQKHIDPRPTDPAFDYIANAGLLEEGRTLNEREELRREALSLDHARELIARQDKMRRDAQTLSTPSGRAVALAVRILDPIALLLIAMGLAIVWAAGGRRIWNRLRRQGHQEALAQ